MKVIPLSEAKAKLGHYARLCKKEPVIVSVGGVPAFEMVPLDQDDNLTTVVLIEHNYVRFRGIAPQEILCVGRTISASEAAKRI